jgi:NAD(P)-dependent dehydrogenase (short-subunit alcohol dehydrogenase family)
LIVSDELPAPFSLTGRVAFATGASSGIGRHFSQLLARSGASVVLPAHRHDRLEALRREIESASERAVSVALEVIDRQSVEAGFAFAAEALGPIDILVNNAGAAEPHPFLEMTEEAWRFVIETDLTGVWSVA